MADPIYLSNGVTFDPAMGNNPDADAQTSTWDYIKSEATNGFAQTQNAITGDILGLFDPGQRITGVEANQRYGYKGPTPDYDVKFDPDSTYTAAEIALQQSMMRQKQQRDFIAATRPQTWDTWGAGQLAGGAGFLANPENDVAFMIPGERVMTVAGGMLEDAGLVGAAARSQALAASLKATAIGRAALTGINQGVGTALMQPLILAGPDQDYRDASFTDVAANVLYGAIGGFALHGLGEVAGATWRSMMRGSAATLETGDAAHVMNADLVAADRSQVVKDLTEQNGVEPAEEAIQAEMRARQQQVAENVKNGAYSTPLPAPESVDAGAMAPEEIADLAAHGKYAEAAQAMQKHTEALESDPELNLSDEEKAEVNEPVDTLGKIKGLMGDFIGCVAAESA